MDGSEQVDEQERPLHVHSIPPRTQPLRDFRGIFGPRTGEEESAEAAHAVGTGYRVVDQYLREGERAASRHWQPVSEREGDEPRVSKDRTELSHAIGRVLDGLSDLGSFGLQLAQSLARPDPPQCRDDWATAGPFTTAHAAPPTISSAVDAKMALRVAIQCDRPVELTLRLEGSPVEALIVTPLCDAEGRLPSISTVSVARGSGPEAGYVIRAQLGAELESGTFHGVVLAGGRPVGTLTLTF